MLWRARDTPANRSLEIIKLFIILVKILFITSKAVLDICFRSWCVLPSNPRFRILVKISSSQSPSQKKISGNSCQKLSKKRFFSLCPILLDFFTLPHKSTARKVSKNKAPSCPYFPACELNTEICGVNPRIQSKYGKTRTRKIPHLGTFCAVSLPGTDGSAANYSLKINSMYLWTLHH